MTGSAPNIFSQFVDISVISRILILDANFWFREQVPEIPSPERRSP